jgi:dihydrofolate reductase
MIKAILAHDEMFGVGKNNDLPWPKNAEDMKWFRDCTLGHVVVMGRKTWESIGSKALPKRRNVVVSSRRAAEFQHYTEDGPDHISNNLDKGMLVDILQKELYPDLHIWIIGGPNILKQALPYVDEIYLTAFPGNYECDTFLEMNEIITQFSVKEIIHGDTVEFTVMKRIDINTLAKLLK